MYSIFKALPRASPPSMKRFIRDQRGVSVVVGALLLTLIVVTAAASFSLFVNQQQKERQEQEQYEFRKEQETLDVLTVHPVKNDSASTWQYLNITIASLHTHTSDILSVNVNDRAVQQGTIWWQNGTDTAWVHNRSIDMDAREQITIEVNLTGGMLNPLSIPTSGYIKIDLFTGYGNTFSRSFLPPTAIAAIAAESLWNGTDYEDTVILDGARSEQPGEGYLLSWNWTIEDSEGADIYNWTGQGRKIRAQFNQSASNEDYTITLTVTNSYGLTGTDVIAYRH